MIRYRFNLGSRTGTLVALLLGAGRSGSSWSQPVEGGTAFGVLRVLAVAAASVAAGIALIARVARLPREEGITPETLDHFYRRLRGLVAGAIAAVFGLLFLIQFAAWTAEVLRLLLIAAVLAVALRPTVDRMSGVRLPLLKVCLPRPASILLIYLVLVAVAVGVGFLVIPRAVAELRGLLSSLPAVVDRVERWLGDLQNYPLVPDLSHLQEVMSTQLLGGLSQALNVLLFAVNLVSSVLSFGLVLVLTFFLILEGDRIRGHLVSLLPPSRREQAREVTARMGRKIEGWLKGVLLLSIFIGAATTVGMWIIGMPYPLILGLLAGLFEFVPMVGAYLGAAPAVAVALFQPTWKLIAVALFFFALQQFENNVLAPLIVGREVEMSPLLTIVALLVGAAVMGILGALLAVPVAAVLQVLWTNVVVPEIRHRHGEPE